MSRAIKKVLLLGSGGLRIGQAGEFDYSGSQAIKALKEENIIVVLVNPNIATVQTDENMADRLYLQPLNVKTVSAIIAKEKPDAILLGFGGQTALNLGLALHTEGVLNRYGVTVLGTSIETIRKAEDRELFKNECIRIGVDVANSVAVTTIEAAISSAREIGYPVMMRSGFSLGGLGSGIVKTEAELKERVAAALSGSPQVLIEECLIGWTEVEYEIVRDVFGNTVTICNMENFDPMGIHTGESIVIAPSQTLNNVEYHRLREIAIQVANHFNIIGECNIQYAYHSATGRYRVIEINPRLSRSSALASKATGYPLAFVATKLALGYPLHAIKNSVTQVTCAFFEPALDYVVVKIPRWDTHKLKSADRRIGTEMKSVGEVMAIGRSFPEALQKAIGMLNNGVDDISAHFYEFANLEDEIEFATDRRLFAIYQFLKQGGSIARVQQLSHIHLWFLAELERIANLEKNWNVLNKDTVLSAKKLGFSDKTIAKWCNKTAAEIRESRKQWGVLPVVKQIDTLAGEWDAKTNYLYLTYHGQYHDIVRCEKPAVVVLGSGPYSIGSSVEFDWCAVNTARTLRELGEYSVMINSNPETVSTDYDESDRLYFEQLSFERVCDIVEFESVKGVIVSVGGQIPNNLALPLYQAGVPILGTSPIDIDRAENRKTFSALLADLQIDQPAWTSVTTLTEAKKFSHAVGFPVLIRPSFVLSGAAMNVVFDETQLESYLNAAARVSRDHPVVISKFVNHAKELEIDGVAQHGEIVIEAMSEHVENAGVHSGDATIVLPPQKLYLETIRRTKKIAREIVKALRIHGPFNLQFIAKDNAIQVIEANVRASRSFPFASKVVHENFIKIATQVMLEAYQPKRYETLELEYVAVKTPQFSYGRLKGANPVAHVEMASTGEVACFGVDLLDAFFRSWQASDLLIPRKKIFLSIGGDKKTKLITYLQQLETLGWDIYATSGTHDYLAKHGVGSYFVHKISDGEHPNVEEIIKERKVDLVINIPRSDYNINNQQITDGFRIRRLAIDHFVPLITNLQSAQYLLHSLIECYDKPITVTAWQEFMKSSEGK